MNLMKITVITIICFLLLACNAGTGKVDKQVNQEDSIRTDRINLDFNKTEEEIIAELSKTYPNLTRNQMLAWEECGELEMRVINEQKKYFRNAVSNLYRLNPEAKQKRDSIFGPRSNNLNEFRENQAKQILSSINNNKPLTSRKWHIQFTITVPPGKVPQGEVIKCWMPYPKPHKNRLSNIELIKVNSKEYHISDSSSLHRSLYIEKEAVAQEPVQFTYEVSFSTQAEWIDPANLRSLAYNKSSELYLRYTKEELPHIVFSKEVMQLADSLSDGLTNPLSIVKSFYYWIDKNIPWASALEYSIFECIPDYVLKYRHGDCGMVSFLFMSMARYKGIPVKWQSGWMLHPSYENLHDWLEVYYEGKGWIPLDMSFGLIPSSNNDNLHNYYITGIDAFRMIVNDAVSAEFDPPKEFYRSEPFDFQRGELEWRGGNLYFDQWDYSLKIISTNEK